MVTMNQSELHHVPLSLLYYQCAHSDTLLRNQLSHLMQLNFIKKNLSLT